MSNLGTVYVAGPMTGYENFNFPSFHRAAAALRQLGWTVLSPAERDLEKHREEIFNLKDGDTKKCEEMGFSLREALKDDARMVCESDAIFMLKGWEKSSGAQAEWALARALSLQVMYE
jgi:hypothetical protein